jgi:Uma2 family endonuclease
MTATQIALLQTPIQKVMRRKPLLPFKLLDRMGLPSEVRIPASFEDWIELSVDCEYRVDYINGHIVSIFDIDTKTKKTMGQATLTHEQLVINIGTMLNILFRNMPDIIVLGSNMPTFLEIGKAAVNPDLVVVKGEPIVIPYKHRIKTQNVLTNPSVVIEILSQGTRNYDLVEKKNEYFRIATVEQVIFVEQYWAQVMCYIRQDSHKWLYIENDKLTDAFPIFDGEILLSDIYQKVSFPK